MFGLPKDRVAYAWRRLREEGAIVTAGRGRSAPPVSALDAAHLLIAVVADFPPKDTTESWREYSQMKPLRRSGPEIPERWSFDLCGVAGLDLPALTSLPDEHTFAEALAAMIAAAGDGSMKVFDQKAGKLQITVELSNFGPPATITMIVGPQRRSVVLFYTNETGDEDPDETNLDDPTLEPDGSPYLTSTRIFHINTLIKLGELVASDGRGKQ